MLQVGQTVSFSPLPYLHALLNPWVSLGVCVLSAWLIFQLSLLSRADLSYVLPVSAVSYVASALLGGFLLHEPVSPIRWAGIALITIGASVVGHTKPRTADGQQEKTP